MSMCMSIAQARTKRVSRQTRPAFSLEISTQSMSNSIVQARTKRWAGDATGISPVNFHTKWLLWTVHVHFDCAGSRKTLVAGDASGISPVNFHTKWLVWNVHVHFDCAGSHKTLSGDVSGIFPANAHTKWLLWDRQCKPVALGLSDRSRRGVVLILRWLAQPSRHFGPVTSLSFWRVAHLDGQGDLAQRFWQGGLRSCTEISYRDLVQRS